MQSKRFWSVLLFVAISLYLGFYLSRSVPQPKLQQLSPLNLAPEDKSLPFFELMSPLPTSQDHWLIPKLEYVKGPPERYLERIQLLVSPPGLGPKERLFLYGRRTREDWRLEFLKQSLRQKDFEPTLAHIYKEALLLVAGQPSPRMGRISFYRKALTEFLLQEEAKNILIDADSVAIMEQAEIPAFLLRYPQAANEPARAKLLFFRKDSLFQIEMRADTKFKVLQPEYFFQKTFLVDNRMDALAFVQKALSQVQLQGLNPKNLSPPLIAWPIALLLAHLSLDPSSLDSYYHFAGLSALLYQSPGLDKADLESLDALRGNVLAAELFAKDIKPDSPRVNEIGYLARNLVRGGD